MEVVAVFDIGKTNKKFILFDSLFDEVYSEFKVFEEQVDSEGYPTEDVFGILSWMDDCLYTAVSSNQFKITALNFSSYGATVVYVNANGKQLGDVVNYLRPFPEELRQEFFSNFGDQNELTREMASPFLGMINSGLQLYFVQKASPYFLNSVAHILHLPQYLSFKYTSALRSEYTSIGCHTMLWDYKKQSYHRWLDEYGLTELLPSPCSATYSETRNIYGL